VRNPNLAHGGAPVVSNIERRVLTGNIAEHSLQVRVGPGPYDVIGHADLFLADEAETLAWGRILSWVRTH
jgi:hypothetical protein